MAEAVRKEPDVNVELVDGSRGEFTVLVDGETMVSKGEQSEMLPDINEVLTAVRKAKPTAGV